MSGVDRVPVMGGLAAFLSVTPLLHVTAERAWLLPAAVVVALVVATGVWLRRVHLPAVLVVLAQLVVAALWIGLIIAGDTAWLGVIPNADWVARLADVFRNGLDTISSYAVPAPVTDGLLMLLIGGSALVAVVVDLIVGLRRAVLAGVPLAVCYAVCAAIAQGALPWWWFVPPAAGYLALMVSDGRTRVASWGRSASPSEHHSGIPETDSLARNGRRVGVVALVAAVGIPALVPALAEGFLGPGSSGGPGGRTIRTDNPIVDLQRNLSRPDNVEVLSYRTDTDDPQYIRTVALDVFNGEIWRTSNRDVPESQSVSEGMPEPPGLRLDDPPVAEYSIQLSDDYRSKWLPLPYPAVDVEIDGDWRYDVATLDVVSGSGGDTRGVGYRARSLQIEPTAAALREAGPYGADLTAMTELPGDLPALVTDLATEVTAEADNDWERAAALQAFFRNTSGPNGFTYSLDVAPETSTSALVAFLEERRGYCQQFAATMAIMARALGIPSRVAVGFTPGDFRGEDTWTVRAHDSHAWPELYFEGVGWVPFEPTPASRTGLAPSWTVEPDDNGRSTPGPSSSPTTPAPTSTAGADGQLEDPTAGAGGSGGDGAARWLPVALLVVGLAAVLCVPAGVARLGRELRWRRAGSDPAAQAEAAWADLRETVADAGLDWNTADTPRMIGSRLSAEAHLAVDDRDLLAHLVSTTEFARYARRARPTPDLRADVDLLRASIRRSCPRRRQIAAFLWPSTVRSAVGSLGGRVADGLDRLDVAIERLRATALRVTRVGARR